MLRRVVLGAIRRRAKPAISSIRRLKAPPARPPMMPQVITMSQSRPVLAVAEVRPEIGVVTDQAERGEAGEDDGIEDQAVGAVLKAAAHFLDGKNDSLPAAR